MKTKLFTLLLAIVASVGTMFAQSGTCGSNLTWDLTNGVLTISGTGNMTNWSSASDVPWYSYRASITEVSIGNSVTSIGYWAFANCTGLTYITIPNSVTSIGDYAFSGCTGLTYITIPNSVTSIGWSAFYGCTGLTSVTIGNSVTSIGDYAFSGCTGLTSITIPNSVTSIGDGAFLGCTNITSVIWNAKNCTDFNASSTPFYNNGCVTLYGETYCDDGSRYDLRTQITTFSLGENVQHIPAYLCCGMSNLTSVTIGNSVTSIGESAFSGCSGLTGGLVIPNSVTSIGNSAFEGCSGLTSVTIPNSVTSIEYRAFSNCTGLTSIEIPNSVTFIGQQAFSGCSGLTSVTIPNSVTSISGWAFHGCSSLTSITIPEGVTSLGEYVFNQCKNLKTIELPSTLVINISSTFGGGFRLDTLRIAANMLSYGESHEYNKNIRYTLAGLYSSSGLDQYDTTNVCQNIKYIEAPYWFFDVQEQDWSKCAKNIETIIVNRGELNDNVLGVISRSYKTLKSLDVSAVTNVEFADEAFKGFYNLQALALPEDLQRVSYMMVAGCKNLKSIDIPASVEEIDQSAFEDCRSLQTITFGGKQPASAPGKYYARAATSNSQLRKIGNWAFYNAHELQHLEIPEGVEEIGDAAFYGCVYMEDLSLPASVRAIGDNCFALCRKLERITVNSANPPEIQAKTFYDVKRQIPVYVPDESVDAYKEDQYWSEFDIQGISHVPQGIENVTNDKSQLTNKILHNGQIFIIRGDKTYTITGQEVK